jgi:aspartate racemase
VKTPAHVGIVAVSAEGAALCYRTLCAEAPAFLGPHMHPEVSLHTLPLGLYMVPLEQGDWETVSELLHESARRLAAAGAQFLICPDNTVHEALDICRRNSPLPWLHIARVVADEALARGYTRLGILGTSWLMESLVYPRQCSALGILTHIPEPEQRERIDGIIFKELVTMRFEAASRSYLSGVIQSLAGAGCDAVVLGCTELPLLIGPADSCLPILDSTRLLARAAIALSLAGR